MSQAIRCAATTLLLFFAQQFRPMNDRILDLHQLSVIYVFDVVTHLSLCCKNSHYRDYERLL